MNGTAVDDVTGHGHRRRGTCCLACLGLLDSRDYAIDCVGALRYLTKVPRLHQSFIKYSLVGILD